MLADEAVTEMKKDAERAAQELAKTKKERAGCALQPDVFTRATLVQKQEVSLDTRFVRPPSNSTVPLIHFQILCLCTAEEG